MSKLEKGLNKQVANLSVFFVKLHHHHWFVQGTQFFNLHEKFEEYYDEINELYDEVAERMLMIGTKPASTLKEYLALTSLSEAKGGESSREMVASILEDFKVLRKEFNDLIPVAQEAGDEVSADMLIGAITNFDKHIWMLSATLGE